MQALTFSPRGAGVEAAGLPDPAYAAVLSDDAVAFLAELQRRFGPERLRLLAVRQDRQRRLDAGEKPDFLAETV